MSLRDGIPYLEDGKWALLPSWFHERVFPAVPYGSLIMFGVSANGNCVVNGVDYVTDAEGCQALPAEERLKLSLRHRDLMSSLAAPDTLNELRKMFPDARAVTNAQSVLEASDKHRPITQTFLRSISHALSFNLLLVDDVGNVLTQVGPEFHVDADWLIAVWVAKEHFQPVMAINSKAEDHAHACGVFSPDNEDGGIVHRAVVQAYYSAKYGRIVTLEELRASDSRPKRLHLGVAREYPPAPVVKLVEESVARVDTTASAAAPGAVRAEFSYTSYEDLLI